MPLPSREQAWSLMSEWIQSDSLRKHALGVEAAMRAYARHFGEDEQLWGVTGLVHDLDFERFPDMEDAVNGHPRTALRLFHQLDYPSALIQAVAGHAPYLGIPRTTRDGFRAVGGGRADRVDHGGRLRAAEQRPAAMRRSSRSRRSGRTALSPPPSAGRTSKPVRPSCRSIFGSTFASSSRPCRPSPATSDLTAGWRPRAQPRRLEPGAS